MIALILLLSVFTRAEEPEDIPKDLGADLLFEDPVAEEENQQNEDEQIDNEEKEAQATPSPTPIPVQKVPIKDIVGYKELGVVTCMIIYLIVFLTGRKKLSEKIEIIWGNLSKSFERHFAVIPEKMHKKNNSTYYQVVTGRTGYKFALITQTFPRCAEPLMMLMDWFSGEVPKLKIEIGLNPENEISAIFHASKTKPSFFDEFKLKESNCSHKIKCYSDMADAKQPLIQIIKEFNEKYPDSIEMIECSDANRFDTRSDSRWVVYFEFRLVYNLEDFIGDDLVDFIVKLADTFTTTKLQPEIQAINFRLRERKLKEKENPQEEKKLTKEEEEKLERKRERREQKRLKPKFKTVKA